MELSLKLPPSSSIVNSSIQSYSITWVPIKPSEKKTNNVVYTQLINMSDILKSWGNTVATNKLKDIIEEIEEFQTSSATSKMKKHFQLF